MTSTAHKIRWAPLAVSTVILLSGTLGLVRDRQFADSIAVALVGTILAVAFAIGALLESQHRAWPAAIALISGVPMVLVLLATGSFRHVLEVNAIAALLLVGSAGTLYSSLSILLRNRRDQVARAVARPRPNE